MGMSFCSQSDYQIDNDIHPIVEKNNLTIDENNLIQDENDQKQHKINSIQVENNTTKDESHTMNYIWIDKNINETAFQDVYYNYIFNEDRKCYKFDNVEQGLQKLFELKFEKVTVICSGRLFPEFFKKYDEKIKYYKKNEEYPFPTVVIFCNEKERFIANLKANKNYDDNYLLNKNLIFNIFEDLVNYINGTKKDNSEDLTFDEVNNLKQLIIPCFYSYLIQDVTKTEIDFYNNFIIAYYHDTDKEKEKQIKAIITNLKRLKTYSKDIISKKWLKIYSMQSDFFIQMNKMFRRNEEGQFIYHPLIKICYEGIRKKFLKSVHKKKLYRGSNISKKELDKLIKKMEEYNNIRKEKKEEFPKVIVYCRSFLSFSEEITFAQKFLQECEENETAEKILYEIENINKEDIDLNTLSNCSLKGISTYNEAEVLLFPYSCFEVIDIKKTESTSYEKYKILLKYLGRYGNPIKEQLGDNFFKYIERTKFSDDLIDNKITLNKDYASSWTLNKIFKNKYNESLFSYILNDKKTILISNDNSIYTICLNSIYEEKNLDINIADKSIKIISLIILDKDQILFSTSNNFIQIIKICEDKKDFKIIFQAYLNFCAYNLLYLKNTEKEKKIDIENENEILDDVEKIVFTNEKSIYSIYQIKNIKSFDEIVCEDTSIIAIKDLPNKNIVYLTEDKNSYTIIHFLDMKIGKKDENKITIKEKLINTQNIVIINDYCYIGFDFQIKVIDYNKKKLFTSFYLDNKITNMIDFANENIIIGLLDEEKNVSIIRELKIVFENSQLYPYIVSEGKIDEYDNIEKFIEINPSFILVYTTYGKLMKYEKKSKINEIFKEAYNKYNNKNLLIKAKSFAKTMEQNISFLGKQKICESNLNDTLNDELILYKNLSQKDIDLNISEIKIDKNPILNAYDDKSNSHFNIINQSDIKTIKEFKKNNLTENENTKRMDKGEKLKKNYDGSKNLYFFFPEANNTPLKINKRVVYS